MGKIPVGIIKFATSLIKSSTQGTIFESAIDAIHDNPEAIGDIYDCASKAATKIRAAKGVGAVVGVAALGTAVLGGCVLHKVSGGSLTFEILVEKEEYLENLEELAKAGFFEKELGPKFKNYNLELKFKTFSSEKIEIRKNFRDLEKLASEAVKSKSYYFDGETKSITLFDIEKEKDGMSGIKDITVETTSNVNKHTEIVEKLDIIQMEGDGKSSTLEENDLRMFYWHVNVNSLNTHFGKLKKEIKSYEEAIDIVCITETNKPLGSVKLNGYDLYITPAKGNRGGAAIYAKKETDTTSKKFTGVRRLEEVELTCQPCSDCEDCNNVVTHESVWIQFERVKDKEMIVVGAIYRHLNKNEKVFKCFKKKIDKALNHTKVRGSYVYLLGDFNMDLIDPDSLTRTFLEMLRKHGLTPLNVTARTCIAKRENPMLIHHIYASDPQANKAEEGVIISEYFAPNYPIYCIV